MAENKTENKGAEKAKKETAAEDGGGEKKKAHNPRVKQKEIFWTLERCMKTARRFQSLEEWAAGTPSCYKAAVARGYIAQCTTHMTTSATKVTKVTKVAGKSSASKKKPAPAAARFKKTA